MKFSTICLLITLSVNSVARGEPSPVECKKKLSILYAGDPKDARTRDFDRFLKLHFKTVDTISYEKFTPDSMARFDVVIFDWGKIYYPEENLLREPKIPKLPKDFSRPMLLIGSSGIRIAEHFGAQLDWF